MDKVMEYISGIEWEKLVEALRVYVEALNFPQFITDVANFIRDIFNVVIGG